MKLVAGSYERFLWGWQVKEKKQHLEWTFSYPAHQGPIKCVAACGAVVATGGSDDTIKVFDLNAQKDMGSLYKHTGAVTCLAFHGPRGNPNSMANHPTHLFSGSEDGTIGIWDTDAWIHLAEMKTKKGSKSVVNDLTIHSSGMVAFSVERGGHMRMWNLSKARCIFTTKLASEASIVKFAPQAGETYSLVRGAHVEIRNAESGVVLQTLEHARRVFCVAQQQDNMLVTGGEDCTVRAWDTRTGKLAWSVASAHSNRIRGLAVLGSSPGTDEESAGLPNLVASASTDGMVRVWDARMVDSSEGGATPAPVMEAETKARLTCLVSCGAAKKSALAISGTVKEEQGVSLEELSSPRALPIQLSSKQKRKMISDSALVKEFTDGHPHKQVKANTEKNLASQGCAKITKSAVKQVVSLEQLSSPRVLHPQLSSKQRRKKKSAISDGAVAKQLADGRPHKRVKPKTEWNLATQDFALTTESLPTASGTVEEEKGVSLEQQPSPRPLPTQLSSKHKRKKQSVISDGAVVKQLTDGRPHKQMKPNTERKSATKPIGNTKSPKRRLHVNPRKS